MKKGFTLIELLAVIIVLGFLTAIISPVVTNLINSSKDNLREEQRNLIVEATKKYMIENSDLLPDEGDDSRVFVYTDELVSSGVIDNDKIIDPKTKEDIKGCVVIRYNDEFNQYEYNYEDDYDNCLINVTFDPEDGSVDITSKQVRYNSTYGDLPTPTREGYTFKGWRGKNMFDGLTKGIRIYSETGEKMDDSKFASSDFISINLVDNNYYINGLPDNLRNFVAFYNENKEFMGRTNGVIVQNRYLVDNSSITNSATGVGGNISYIRITIYELDGYTTGIIDDIDNLNIQLEQGDTATSYEPYQEYSSDTVVTKSSNHTLHAIWEPNSYTVTFDPEGGSVDTVSKQVRYNSTYGDLPTPTREGYRFLGWCGKNMFSKDNTTYENTANHAYITFENNSIIFDASNVEENSASWIFVSAFKDDTLVSDGYGSTKTAGIRYKKVLDLNGAYDFNRIRIKINTTKRDAKIGIKNVLDQSKKYTVSFNIDELDFEHAKATISDFQLEDGEVATEYEPYQEYNSDTIVTKPSDHVLHAIWEVAS